MVLGVFCLSGWSSLALMRGEETASKLEGAYFMKAGEAVLVITREGPAHFAVHSQCRWGRSWLWTKKIRTFCS